MKYKNVKHSILLGIALLVSFLINLPRVLQLNEIVGNLSDSFAQVTIKDVTIRTVFLFAFSWLVLQFNSNWKFSYVHLKIFSRNLITITVNVVLFFVAVFLFVFVHQKLTGANMYSSDKGLLYFVYAVVLLILVFISRILRYQIIRQDDVAEKELLKQQSLKNELEALKNQINPHFLFNSLNSLNSLIRDNKPATTFVNKLSFMYRYILQSGSEDLVALEEELKFLESYIYLIKTRYRDRFSVEIDVDNRILTETMPALALQLLVENAVKHNEISVSNPLLVKVYSNNDFIVIENKIKPRTTFVDSTGNGLVNLDKRYQMLKKKSIIISNNNQKFKVKLPIK
ncbi:sensor histidine kinase [Seonamhaeicola maritimus]|uniref:sensor histidine kinase n=1 Tax=Seonamhaeicola maritimus TaxID=2591822 RepID=UPI0019D654C9|nr:histidine kinase [Seonamhaeicola maritimus]